MQKILITGATGFLGSHLVKYFLKNKFQVDILKRKTSDTWRINRELDSCTIFNFDELSLDEIISASKPDTIIHTICEYGRQDSSISHLIEVNVMLGAKILEASIKNKVNLFVNTDSLLPRGINDYSLSKRHFSEWLKSRSHLINIINFRIEHMYGPEDDPNKFVGWLINKMLDSKTDKIELTSGIQRRDFIYIDDVVDAFALVIEKQNQLNAWTELDLATQNFISVKEFILKLANQLETLKKNEIQKKLKFGVLAYRSGEIMEPILNDTTLKNLGWEPKYNIIEGINKLVNSISE